MESIIKTDPDKCVKCMSCIRACKVNSNIVKEEFIDVVPEMCIVCGACIETCPENARTYISHVDVFKNWLKKENVIVILAPSYLAHFDEPYKFVAFLKKAGVSLIYEVAIGAELSSIVIAEEIKSGKKVIASPCPTIVNYIKKWMPELLNRLSRAVSPMIATARYIRRSYPDSKIVFVGPCISKKSEIFQKEVIGDVDLVLTFEEIDRLIDREGIDFEGLEEMFPDELDNLYGTLYPVTGGLAKTVSFYLEKEYDMVIEKDMIVVDGKENVMRFLKKYAENIKLNKDNDNPVLAEVLYCSGGCVGGPGIRNDLEIFEKKRRIVEHSLRRISKRSRNMSAIKSDICNMNLRRSYEPEKVEYRIPDEEAINEVLRKIGMLEKPLNCGACGYPTCRDRAIAVLNGLLPWDLCIQYQLKKMEERHKKEIAKIRKEAIENAQKVISKQMKIAQEIASLLGETVAETKASLLKVLNLFMDDMEEDE